MSGSPQFKSWLATRWSPLCLVIASPDAEALCAASGLSVVDLLAPHCSSSPNGTWHALRKWAANEQPRWRRTEPTAARAAPNGEG